MQRWRAAGLMAVLGWGGAACSLRQPVRNSMRFLPPPPAGAVAPLLEAAEPPGVPANLFLHDTPAILLRNIQPPSARTRADTLVQRSQQRFERGRKYYHSGDMANARRDFDAAVDLMLEASDHNPVDRQFYERKMDEMVEAIHRYDLTGMGAAAVVEEGRFEKAPLEDLLQMTFPVDPRLKDRVREQVAATVSQLPLSVNDAVLGYIQYFSKRGHRTLVAALQRAGRYRPMIQRILDEEGVPQELIHLAQAESGFIPSARSRMKAVGMWQFVAFRGKEYGLDQSLRADERRDPEKATRAAARHLRDLYTQFGDWYLAIAAYNCGPVTVEKAVERTGYADFWELRRRAVLPLETTNYVPIILAMTIMTKNAAEYELDQLNLEPPLEYDTVEIAVATHLALISDLTETPVSQLMELNPALLKPAAPEGYSLHVPKGTGSALTASLELVPPARRLAWRVHKVGYGETVASIGKRYSTAASSLLAANALKATDAVREGDRLVVPAAPPAPRPTARRAAGKTPPRPAAKKSVTQRASR